MLIYGRHPVMDAIKSGQIIEKIVIQKDTNADLEAEIRQASKKQYFPVQYVPKERANKITSENHQGIIAYMAMIHYHDAEKLCDSILENQQQPLILILDGITDVRNFGAIARSAECAGVAGIIIQQKSSAPINAASIKASAGALTKMSIGRINSLGHLIGYLQNTGWQVLATDLKAEQQLMEVDFKMPTAVIMGSEGSGVSKYLLRSVDDTFIIPQVGTTDSFNVSVATGIVLYEAMKQKL